MLANEYEEVGFELAFDSGSVDYVCAESDIPGYQVVESELSRRNQYYIVGNAKAILNEGESSPNLKCNDLGGGINGTTSTFQVAKIVRPMMPASRICNTGMTVSFDSEKATVQGKDEGWCVTSSAREGDTCAR